MDRRVRIFALFLIACFVLLFLQLANVQVRQSRALKASPFEVRGTGDVFAGDRGEILSSDGHVLAVSLPSKGPFPYQRVYPAGPLFADVTGYVNVVNANISTGLEAEYGNPLGSSPASQYLLVHQYPTRGLKGILASRRGTDSITTTISYRLQQVAQQALGGLKGAVVALDPQNGDILAMYSNPTYNPNDLASHDPREVAKYYASLDPASPSSPLANGVTYLAHPPGSTFKIVTSSAVFDHMPKLASATYPYLSSTGLPNTTQVLHNYADERCGGSLLEAFVVSCDTTYGLVGLELGPRYLSEEAQAFGFGQVPPIDLPPGEVSPSYFPKASSFSSHDPFLAYSAIGQGNVTETPLEDALIAGAIADKGTIMTPHLLSHVIDDEGNIVASYRPHPWLRATSPATAQAVLAFMRGVVADPNGTGAGIGFPASLHVAAKTGTAQVGSNGVCTDNWFVASAPAGLGETPKVAVAAFVPYQPGVACASTGAQSAGPVVRSVLDAALGYGG
jgi:peptidoglycan glycosyltransferase